MPLPKRPLNDHEQDALSTLTQHMGNPLDDFDMGVAKRMEELVHEAGAKKMHAAQTGGDSDPLAPPQIQQQAVKGQQAGLQSAENQGQLKAAQAQAAQAQGNEPTPEGPMPPPPKPPKMPPPQAAGPQGHPPTGPVQPPAAPEQEQPPPEEDQD